MSLPPSAPFAGDWRFEALYVGETNDFHDRLNTGLVHHDGFKRARANGATHVAVRRVAVSDCLTVETDLRHGLNPHLQPPLFSD